jgi:hypothetical protein
MLKNHHSPYNLYKFIGINMPENNNPNNEEKAMLLQGPLAVEFFTLYLSRSPGKKVHLLTGERYLTVENGNHFTIITDANGNKFPKGIDKFIETSLKDKSCYGLVPLTELAEQRLKDKELDNFPAGPITFFHSSLKYEVYRG